MLQPVRVTLCSGVLCAGGGGLWWRSRQVASSCQPQEYHHLLHELLGNAVRRVLGTARTSPARASRTAETLPGHPPHGPGQWVAVCAFDPSGPGARGAAGHACVWIMREQSYGVMAKPLSRALAQEWKDNNAASSGSTGVVGQRGLLLAWCLLLCNIGQGGSELHFPG